ncbi:hypothetical protein ACTFIU_008760 [Dictyostelium citrinum]
MISQTITLPLYIQKFIIKKLCEFINVNNKILDTLGTKIYRVKEAKIKELMLNLALVSHSWFNTLSNNLNVSVDFNYSDTQFSIIKTENVKTLKLHYDHDEYYFYKRSVDGYDNKDEVEIPHHKVIEELKKLKSLPSNTFKNLIIRNINNSNGTSIQTLLNQIQTLDLNILNEKSNDSNDNGNDEEDDYDNEKKQTIGKLNLLEYTVLSDLQIEGVRKLKDLNVKNIFCLQSFATFNILNELLKIYSRNLKQLLLLNLSISSKYISQLKEDGSDTNELLPCFKTLFSLNKCKSIVFYSNNGVNHRTSNRSLNIYGTQLRLKDIENLLNFKNNDNLESLSIILCLKNLSYFSKLSLSPPKESVLKPLSIVSSSTSPSLPSSPSLISSPSLLSSPSLISSPSLLSSPSLISSPSLPSSPSLISSPSLLSSPLSPPSLDEPDEESDEEYDEESSNEDSRCNCSGIITKNQNEEIFKKNWDSLIECLNTKTKNLKHIDISSNGCSSALPNVYMIGAIAKLLNSIPSLESFSSFGFPSIPMLINELFSPPSYVCSITKFTFYMADNDITQTQITELIQPISFLLQKHHSISNFKLYNYYLNSSFDGYSKKLIFDFEK